MQYSTVLLSLLAATGAFAAPAKRTTADTGIEVRLQADTFFLHVPMPASVKQEKRLGERFQDKEFSSIQILAKGAAKPRCKVTNAAGEDIIATRGQNVDTTFSDGGKAEWKFDSPTLIRKIICDPDFVANNINVNFVPEGTATASGSAPTVLPTDAATQGAPLI